MLQAANTEERAFDPNKEMLRAINATMRLTSIHRLE